MAKSNEPGLWWIFSAGGVVSALFVPILMIITGIGVPLSWFPQERLSYIQIHKLVSYPITRVFLFVLIAFSLFHAAHRLRYALVDMGFKKVWLLITLLCYGGAIAGIVFTVMVLQRF